MPNPDRSVAELLREQGAINEGQVEALQCLVSAHLRNHSGDMQLRRPKENNWSTW